MTKILVVIAGPTGIGKTQAAIELANHFHSEIISSDSRQIFKELKVGTAVPSEQELQKIKHHFIQSHSIFENYNASKYETDVLELLDKLFLRKNIVILAGGSMLYIDAVCKGIDIMPDADMEIREKLKSALKREGLESLRMQLKKIDPEYYSKVDLKNPARIIHTLEIYFTTGKPYTSFLSNSVKKRSFLIIKIGLDCIRSELHDKINRRVDKMMDEGFEQEALSLYPYRDLPALNTVGYKEMFAYFNHDISLEKAVELIKRNTRRYARKQLTWLRGQPEYMWFKPHEMREIIKYVENEIAGNEFE